MKRSARPRDALPSALGDPDRLTERLAGRRPAVFLDYDGVLTPIVAHPDLAVLTADMRRAVERLAAATPVAIVSGRDTADVRTKVGVSGVMYAGSHGFDITDVAGVPVAGEELRHFDRFLPVLDRAAGEAASAIASVRGAHVERKRFAIAVHFRQSPPEAEPVVEAAIRGIAERYDGLRMTGGKKIFELRPDLDWHKGRALEWLMRTMDLDSPDIAPCYLGDDVTDEDAFRVVATTGVGIVVGRDGPPTLAHMAVEDPGEVRQLLDRLRELAES